MTEEEIKYSIETGKLKISIWDKFSHYGIVVLLLIIPALFLFFHIKDYFQGTLKPMIEGEIWFVIVALIIAYLFYRLQKKRLALNHLRQV